MDKIDEKPGEKICFLMPFEVSINADWNPCKKNIVQKEKGRWKKPKQRKKTKRNCINYG